MVRYRNTRRLLAYLLGPRESIEDHGVLEGNRGKGPIEHCQTTMGDSRWVGHRAARWRTWWLTLLPVDSGGAECHEEHTGGNVPAMMLSPGRPVTSTSSEYKRTQKR